MATISSQVTALNTRQDTALLSATSSTGTLSTFMSEPAGTNVSAGGSTLNTLAGQIAAGAATAQRKAYELNWYQSDLSPYADAAAPLFLIYPGAALTIDKAMAGSFFQLATPATEALTMTVSIGSQTITLTFAANAVGATWAEADADIVVNPGDLITAQITSDLNSAAGLTLTLVGTYN